MKKTLIILIFLLGLIWLLIMPAVVGGYLGRWVPGWLEEMGVSDGGQFKPGWFSSELKINDALDLDLDLQLRHFPPLGLNWIAVDGELESPLSSATMDVSGQLGLRGSGRFQVSGPDLAFAGPVQLSSGPASLALNQALGQPSALSLRLDNLLLEDALDNQLAAENSELRLGWLGLDDDNLALSLNLEMASASASAIELALSASPVQRDALADLIEGLQQLARTEAQSTAQQFALLTVAGAWQQLSQNGLEIRLENLQIGAENQFIGEWKSAEGQPLIQGEGMIDSLTASLIPVVGLSAQLPPAAAEQLIQAWLEQLRVRGWLTIDEQRFEFLYPDQSPGS